MNESPLCDHLACTLHVNMHSRNRNYDGCYFSFRQWKRLFQELQPHSLIVYVDGERAGKVLCFQTTRYYVCDGILITKRMLIAFSLRLLCFFLLSSPAVICWNVLVDWQHSHRARNGRVPHGRQCPEQVTKLGRQETHTHTHTHTHLLPHRHTHTRTKN